MPAVPSDELDDTEPRQDYELLYRMAMLRVGDPDVRGSDWAELLPEWRELFKFWVSDTTSTVGTHSHSNAAFLQYCIWYERERGNATLIRLNPRRVD